MTVESVVIGKDSNGNPVRIGVTDSGGTDANGNELYKLQVDSNLTAPSITIGSVRVEDGVASTLATVKAPASVGATDPALAVQNYTIGLTSDAAVASDAAGTLSAKIRGLVKIFADVWNSTSHALGIEGKGTAGTQTGGVLTVQGDPSGTALPVSLTSNIELGEVKLLDAGGTNVGKIAASSSIAEANNLLGVQAPVLGLTTGAAVVSDANGTVQQYLRGLVKLFAAVLPSAVGQQAMAGSFPVVVASDQSAIPVSGNVGNASATVNEASQASTSSYVAVTGCTIDSLAYHYVSFTLINLDGTNALTWQVLAGNQADLSDAIAVKAGASVIAGATDNYAANPAVYRYYQPQIKDTVGGTHASAKVAGIAKA